MKIKERKQQVDVRVSGTKIRKGFRDWQLWLLLLPGMIYVFIWNYIPMYGVQLAFRDYSIKRGIWGSEWVGLKYVIEFLKYPKFWHLFSNTLRISLYNLATFPCAVIFALMLNEVRNQKLKKTIQMISYMPHFLSLVVVCSLLTLLLKEETGVVNQAIVALGGESIGFLTEPTLYEDVHVWSGVWCGIGFGSIIYISALAGVDPELIDAARIDGANRFRIIWHVNIPHIIPTIVILLILECGSAIGVGHEKVLLLQNPLNLSRSQVISTYTYEMGIRGGQFSYSAAIGFFNTVINIILIVIVNSIAKRVNETSLW